MSELPVENKLVVQIHLIRGSNIINIIPISSYFFLNKINLSVRFEIRNPRLSKINI